MNKWIIIVVALLSTACSDKPSERTILRLTSVCGESTVNDRAAFTLQCIKNASPSSDEEPEDWLHICQRIAEDTYCEKKTVMVKQSSLESGGYGWIDIKIEDVPTVREGD